MRLGRIDPSALEQIALALAERGYGIWPNFWPQEEVQGLLAEAEAGWNAGVFAPAHIGHHGSRQRRPEIRGDWIRWLDPEALSPAQARYWAFIEALLRALNRTLYLGLHGVEMHLAIYPPGTGYRRHLDQFRDAPHRVVTCLLYLNPDWKQEDGGRLLLWPDPNREDVYEAVLPEAGTFVCFLSDRIWHEVEVARRVRYSLTGWLRRRTLWD
nr:MAG: 2OG-Fe(II) oxygenase [Bacteroidota bacterium]